MSCALFSDINAVQILERKTSKKMNNITTNNNSIPITKMVNDLFLQWLSLSETQKTLYAALQSVKTNSKMPDPINYPKVSDKHNH